MINLPTLSTLFNCNDRIGTEASVCSNCQGTHMISEELLKKVAKEWVDTFRKFENDAKFREQFTELDFYDNQFDDFQDDSWSQEGAFTFEAVKQWIGWFFVLSKTCRYEGELDD